MILCYKLLPALAARTIVPTVPFHQNNNKKDHSTKMGEKCAEQHKSGNTNIPLEVFRISVALGDNINKMAGQNKRNSFPLHMKLALEVPQKVAKINVEHLKNSDICKRPKRMFKKNCYLIFCCS